MSLKAARNSRTLALEIVFALIKIIFDSEAEKITVFRPMPIKKQPIRQVSDPLERVFVPTKS